MKILTTSVVASGVRLAVRKSVEYPVRSLSPAYAARFVHAFRLVKSGR